MSKANSTGFCMSGHRHTDIARSRFDRGLAISLINDLIKLHGRAVPSSTKRRSGSVGGPPHLEAEARANVNPGAVAAAPTENEPSGNCRGARY